MSRILVTGINGFVGRHLVRELVLRGCEVAGIGHRGPADQEISGLLDSYHVCDFTDEKQVMRLPLQDVDVVVNLAGLANVGASFDNPQAYERVNVLVLKHLAKHLGLQNPAARLVAVSTGAVYSSEQTMPLTEESEIITDGSPYAISKVLMEKEALKFRAKGMDVVIARPFNHLGPGQATGFLVPDLYDKILAAVKTSRPVVVGNLKTRRDYTDVRDIVKAYADLALSDNLRFDVYNVCSGNGRSGEEILSALLSAMEIKGGTALEVDQLLIRPNDPYDLYGNCQRLQEETGWKPVIPFEQTVRDFIAAKRRAAPLT